MLQYAPNQKNQRTTVVLVQDSNAELKNVLVLQVKEPWYGYPGDYFI